MSLVSVTLLCDSNTDENRFGRKIWKKIEELGGGEGWVTENKGKPKKS